MSFFGQGNVPVGGSPASGPLNSVVDTAGIATAISRGWSVTVIPGGTPAGPVQVASGPGLFGGVRNLTDVTLGAPIDVFDQAQAGVTLGSVQLTRETAAAGTGMGPGQLVTQPFPGVAFAQGLVVYVPATPAGSVGIAVYTKQ